VVAGSSVVKSSRKRSSPVVRSSRKRSSPVT
jgi:hypothetical protein